MGLAVGVGPGPDGWNGSGWVGQVARRRGCDREERPKRGVAFLGASTQAIVLRAKLFRRLLRAPDAESSVRSPR